MAARVGSVIVDIVANTAELTEGTRQAAADLANMDRFVTEKAWNASRSNDGITKSVDAHAKAQEGLSRSVGTATASLAAQSGVASRASGILFMLTSNMGRMWQESKRAAEAHNNAARATGALVTGTAAATTAGKVFAGTVAVVGAKVALIAAALYGLGRAFKFVKGNIDELKAQTEGTEPFLKAAAEDLRFMYEASKGQKDPFEELVKRFQAGKVPVRQAFAEMRALVAADVARTTAESAQKVAEQVDDVLDAVRSRSTAAGMDLYTGQALTEEEKKVRSINDAYVKLAQQAATIADERRRERVIDLLYTAQEKETQLALSEIEAKRAEDAAKASADRITLIRKEAAEIAQLFGRRAGLALGVGADAWRAVQDSLSQFRSDEAERAMLGKSGALDTEDKRNLRDMRQYLYELTQQEAVSI